MASARGLDIPADVVFRELDREALVIHMGLGTYFGLDEVGVVIWKAIETHGSAEGAVRALAARYDAPVEELRRDVEAFVRTLVGKGLLARSSPGASR